MPAQQLINDHFQDLINSGEIYEAIGEAENSLLANELS